MTSKNKQMYDDFQLVFNNLSSNLAPGLDIFEISMYLTKAYFTFVSQTYEQYEKSEAARKALTELVTNVKLAPYNFTDASDYQVTNESTFFKLPTDLLYIVYEQVQMPKDVPEEFKCLKGKNLEVTPIKHDDFHQVYDNPFRYNKKKALRLDVTNAAGERLSEIVVKSPRIQHYFLRYIRKPKPIILDNLTDDGTATGNAIDYIEGQYLESECELNTIFFQDIVRLAAKMAYQDYKAA